MKNFKSLFIAFGIISIVIAVIGIITSAKHYETPNFVFYIGVGMAVLFWIWSIGYVAANHYVTSAGRILWLIVVVSAPVVGGLVFCMMNKEQIKLEV